MHVHYLLYYMCRTPVIHMFQHVIQVISYTCNTYVELHVHMFVGEGVAGCDNVQGVRTSEYMFVGEGVAGCDQGVNKHGT